MKGNFKKDRENLLYHFTKSDIALTKILPLKQLRLNDIEKTNDPREYKTLGFGIIDNVTLKLNSENLKPEKISKEIKRNCKVSGFCKDYYVEKEWWDGFNLFRMWAQYGENHKGVCLVIDKDLFIEENENIFSDPFTFYKSIKYTNKDPYKFINYKEINSEGLDDYIENFIRSYYKYLFFRKHNDWKTEYEWRLIHYNANEVYCSIQKSLKSVITGFDFDKLEDLKRNVFEDGVKLSLAQYVDGNIVI